MDLKEFNKQTVEQINKQLEELLKEWRREISGINSSLLPLIDQFIDSCKEGKRIRGVLVVLGYQLAAHLPGVKARPEGEEIFKIAAAYEIFHRALLAHDDVIDQSIQRNSQPSLYQALGGDHQGQSLAVCLGDAGFFLTAKIISGANFPDRPKSAALQWFAQIALETTLGQLLDICKADPLAVARLKTARYSICGPLILGAILGGARPSPKGGLKVHDLAGLGLDLRGQIKARGKLGSLSCFGQALGIAYQIQDDILGVFGNKEQTGKSVMSDIEEGKNTLLISFAYQKATSLQKRFLDQYYGRGKINSKTFKQIRQIFLQTQALHLAKKTAEKYQQQALKILPGITKDEKMSKILKQLAEYLVQRTK